MSSSVLDVSGACGRFFLKASLDTALSQDILQSIMLMMFHFRACDDSSLRCLLTFLVTLDTQNLARIW